MGRKFLADAMLKKLAEWLRILGLDVEYDYSEGKSDRQIISHAKRKKLVLLTRDARMLPSLRKRKARFMLVNSTNTEEQIAQVLRNYGCRITFPENTRCPKCNGTFLVLKKVPRFAVPPSVYRRKRKFWRCRKCGKIYWKGGHWKNMAKTISAVKGLLSRGAARQRPSLSL